MITYRRLLENGSIRQLESLVGNRLVEYNSSPYRRRLLENGTILGLEGSVGNRLLEYIASTGTYRRLLENGSIRQLEGPVGDRLLQGSSIFLPYEFTSVVIAIANTDPFGIDPEQTSNIP